MTDVPADEQAYLAQVGVGDGDVRLPAGGAKIAALPTIGVVFVVAPHPAVGRKEQQGIVTFAAIQQHQGAGKVDVEPGGGGGQPGSGRTREGLHPDMVFVGPGVAGVETLRQEDQLGAGLGSVDD